MTTLRKLPYKFEEKREEKKYMNPGSFPEGESRFRVVSMPISGWLAWNGNNPSRTLDQPLSNATSRSPAKKVWIMQIWNYSKKKPYILEVSQKSLIWALEAFWDNPTLGDYDAYDLVIQKTGTGMGSKYKLTACAPSKLPSSIKAFIEETEIRIEALFEGKDPWKDLDGFKVEQHYEQEEEDEVYENLG